jgi:protein CpxP
MNVSNTRKMSIRQLLAPALLAIAIAPLAFTAQANHHGDPEGRGADRERMEERMEERRQEVYERAGISEEKQAELNEAHTEHREAMHALREEHKERVADILSEEEQEALRTAMREAHEEHRGKHGKRDHHGENADSE